METKLIKVCRPKPEAELLQPAVQALQRGEIVAFPTETVYGLGAVWNRPEAVREIFRVKGRPQDNPLIVHETSVERMKFYFAEWDAVADLLARTFCPGAFTLIMKKSPAVSSPVTAGLDTIAVRIPEHPVPRLLIELCGQGLAAPSANISGRPSPTNAADAWEDLQGKVPFIIDGGPCDFGVESTIVSWTSGKLELLRPGGVSAEAIEAALAAAGLNIPLLRPSSLQLPPGAVPRAPGMKYRHYAPQARVHVLTGASTEEKFSHLRKLAEEKRLGAKPTFYISRHLADRLHAELPELAERAGAVIAFSEEKSHAAAAQGLFAAFRQLDRLGASDIWAEEQSSDHVGAAYMNRLLKAAAGDKQGVLPPREEERE